MLALAFEWAQKNENPISVHKVMAKKWEQVRKFDFLAITLWPIIGLASSLAQMIALGVGNRMVYGLAEFDQIQASYGQSSTNVETWIIPPIYLAWEFGIEHSHWTEDSDTRHTQTDHHQQQCLLAVGIQSRNNKAEMKATIII